MIINHTCIHNTVVESEIYERVTGVIHDYMKQTSFDRENLNYIIARFEPDHIIAFAPTMCNTQHAAISIVRDGKPQLGSLVSAPGMSHDRALGLALDIAEQHREI